MTLVGAQAGRTRKRSRNWKAPRWLGASGGISAAGWMVSFALAPPPPPPFSFRLVGSVRAPPSKQNRDSLASGAHATRLYVVWCGIWSWPLSRLPKRWKRHLQFGEGLGDVIKVFLSGGFLPLLRSFTHFQSSPTFPVLHFLKERHRFIKQICQHDVP